jgi:hypothetical protein
MKSPERNRRGPEADVSRREADPLPQAALAARHWRWGWWSLLGFLCLGLVLEMLHGFKDPGYVSPSQSTRRLMWTLAHAHGTLLALVQLGFAAFLGSAAGREADAGPRTIRRQGWASALLLASQGLLPTGFLLGGWFFRGGDPGIGVFLVPVGAVCLAVAVGLIAASTAGPAKRPQTPRES